VDSNNPAAISLIVTEIEATPGVPASVLPALEQLKQPGVTPIQVLSAIQSIEAAIAASSTSVLSRL
jgi:hypothetical protein